MLATQQKPVLASLPTVAAIEPQPESRHISVRDVSLWLGRPGHRRLALDRINFACEKRKIIGLVGPSGSGKSTLLKTVGGLLKPDSGEVLIDGKPAIDAMRNNRFGLVFQQPVLLPWRNAEDNVTFTAELVDKRVGENHSARKERTERARELLDLVGLSDHLHKYPRELSGGMQQRVSIARALMTQPDILLMDEPFSALDEVIRERLNLTLLRIWERTEITIVFVTHSLTEAAFLTDDIFVMGADPGRIIDHIPVRLERPRTLDTYRLRQFTDLTMYLREVLGAASDDERSQDDAT
jgi:NitT/TauT family transport system ATP-binding protein